MEKSKESIYDELKRISEIGNSKEDAGKLAYEIYPDYPDSENDRTQVNLRMAFCNGYRKADQETSKLKEENKRLREELEEAKVLLKMFNSICESTYRKEMFAEWVESKEYQKFLNKSLTT